ncbi:helix loop helix DNA-binding domain protein [Ceratobasidium sp. AG-Ba]|nr:helix loop helix DNA-binding domain protein [Ceratobasidium sp. AG-Ba]
MHISLPPLLCCDGVAPSNPDQFLQFPIHNDIPLDCPRPPSTRDALVSRCTSPHAVDMNEHFVLSSHDISPVTLSQLAIKEGHACSSTTAHIVEHLARGPTPPSCFLPVSPPNLPSSLNTPRPPHLPHFYRPPNAAHSSSLVHRRNRGQRHLSPIKRPVKMPSKAALRISGDLDPSGSDEEGTACTNITSAGFLDDRRQRTVESEQRRRNELRGGFARLKDALPVSREKCSKVILLDRATTYIAQLEAKLREKDK